MPPGKGSYKCEAIMWQFNDDMIGSIAYGINIDAMNNPKCEFREKGKAIFEFNMFRGMKLFFIFFYPDISRLISLNFFGKKSTDYLRNVFWDTIIVYSLDRSEAI